MATTSNTRLIIPAILAILSFGMIAALLGTLLPDLSKRFQLTPEQSGNIAVAQALGLIIASVLAGPLIDNKGTKTAFLLGLALTVIALFSLPYSGGSHMITVTMFLLGLGSGTIVTGANTLVSDIGKEKRASLLSFSHLFSGMGALLTPFIAANVVAGDAMMLCYLVAAVTTGTLIVCIGTAMPPPSRERRFKPSEAVQLQGKAALLLLSVFLFLYVACEVGFWNWLVKHLIAQGIPERLALNILSLGFALGILVGRLASAYILKKFSALTVTLGASVLMATTTFLTLQTADPAWAWVLVFCAGLAMAPVYPSTMAMTGDAFPRMTATCMGIVITSGWIGVAVSSWMIGIMAGGDYKRLRMALLLLPTFSVAMVLINLILRPMLTKARKQAA